MNNLLLQTLRDATLSKAERFAAVERLVEGGADVNCKEEYGDGYAPLHLCCLYHLPRTAETTTLQLMKFLLDSGAEVDARDSRGNTPLMLLATTSPTYFQLATLLLRHGADPDAALQLATRHRRPRAFIKLLKDYANKEKRAFGLREPFMAMRHIFRQEPPLSEEELLRVMKKAVALTVQRGFRVDDFLEHWLAEAQATGYHRVARFLLPTAKQKIEQK